MKTTALTTVFTEQSIVLATAQKRVFAGEVIGILAGACHTIFYTVRDCKTGREYTVPAVDVLPFVVEAKLESGATVFVQVTRLDKQHPGDFLCLYDGVEEDLPRRAIVRVVLPLDMLLAA